jgi:hydroxymethylbilane synthase
MLPAPGQGALAVETREGDTALTADVRGALDDAASRAAVLAERTVLADLEAGCAAPVGALAEVVEGEEEEELWLRAVALSPDGMLSVRRSATGSPDDPIGLGHVLAGEMVTDGASKLLGDPPMT